MDEVSPRECGSARAKRNVCPAVVSCVAISTRQAGRQAGSSYLSRRVVVAARRAADAVGRVRRGGRGAAHGQRAAHRAHARHGRAHDGRLAAGRVVPDYLQRQLNLNTSHYISEETSDCWGYRDLEPMGAGSNETP